VLKDVSLVIRPGDRVLLQGPSGAGKSTLAAVLGGLRPPSRGTLVGAGGVTLAPQFHENHLVSASLAFNLLLGRAWPPAPDDLREAWEVCEELGLGPVLAQMPAGIEQPVGEVGWQLSHGERSRLYVARALLSGGRTIVVDESFAALDPEAMQQTLACVLRRAPALVVIAHE
jgi:ATP-binding cassette subfamily B protein